MKYTILKFVAVYNLTQLNSCFAGLIGFRSERSPTHDPVSSTLLVDSPTPRFESFHPLVTLGNLYKALPDLKRAVDCDNVWSNSTVYTQSVLVSYDSKVYKLLAASSFNEQPDANPTVWEETNVFSRAVEELNSDAIYQTVEQVMQHKKMQKAAKALFESRMLYSQPGTLNQKHTSGGGEFRGFEIELESTEQIALAITRIGTQFDGAQGSLPLYIYHSSQKSAIATITLDDLNDDVSFEWTEITEQILKVQDNTHDAGLFYIGYFESDLNEPIQAVYRIVDLSRPNACGSCSSYDSKSRQLHSKYFKIRPIYVELADLDGISLFDITGIKEPSGTLENCNWGLNLDLYAFCDYTQFICKHKTRFQKLYGLQFASIALNVIAYSTEASDGLEAIKNQARLEIQRGIEKDPLSLAAQLNRAVKELHFDTSNINSVCLPCEVVEGPTFDSIL